VRGEPNTIVIVIAIDVVKETKTVIVIVRGKPNMTTDMIRSK